MSLPYSGQRVAVDGILIPTGDIAPNLPYSVNDFWTAPKQVGANFSSPDLVGNCGTGCRGYDNCWLVNREQNGPYNWRQEGPVASIASAYTGITVDVFTEQQAFQVYSCNGMNGPLSSLAPNPQPTCGLTPPTLLTPNRLFRSQINPRLLQRPIPAACCPAVRLPRPGGGGLD